MEKLPALNHAIKYGDSIVDDPAYTKAPFSWDKEFPFKFDVVLGNPPYVRQEFLSPIKPALQKIYPDTFNGVADLYTYFYRRGFQLLKDDGFLGFITSSTFTKTSSGEPLRAFLKNSVTILEFVDFGDLQIFQDATTYPCIFIAKNKTPQPPLKEGGLDGDSFSPPFSKGGREVQAFTSETQNTITFMCVNQKPDSETDWKAMYTKSDIFTMPQASLGKDSWNFDRQDVEALRKKIFYKGKPLKEVVGAPLFGIKTGLNEAFIIDKVTKDRLIREDSKSKEIIKPYLQGRDLKQWHYDYQDRYLIYIPWHFPLHDDTSIQGPSRKAEELFKNRYPAVYNHLFLYKDKLLKRNKAETEIRYEWYALQRFASDYYKAFEEPKILNARFQRIPKFIFDNNGNFLNAPDSIVAKGSLWLTGILNTRVIWHVIQSNCDALRGGLWRYVLYTNNIETFPIVEPPGSEDDPSTPKGKLSQLAKLCQDSAFERYRIRKDFLEIVGDEVRQNRPADDRKKASPEDDDVSEGSAINRWDTLGWDEIVKSAQSPSAFGKPFKDYTKNPINTLRLKKVYQELAPKCHELTRRIHEAEREINQIVYGLYELTPDEIGLLEEQTGNIYED